MSKKEEPKFKKVKARIISEEGDLEFALIDVPVEDPRPEYTGGALASATDAQRGNPLKNEGGLVVGV